MNPLLIVPIIEAAIKLIEFIKKITTNNKITAAWTAEERAMVSGKVLEMDTAAHWQTDADKGV